MNFSLNQLLKWLILTLLFPLIFLNGWLLFKLFQYFQPLVTTFVLAILLAFILNYPVTAIQEKGLNRNYAVALVVILTLITTIGLGITLLPIVLEQFHQIAKLLPQWINSSESKLENLNKWVFGQRLQFDFGTILTNIINRLPDELEYLSDKLFSLVIDTIDSLSEALITVVLTVYLLIDGERIANGIFNRLPTNIGQPIKNSLQQNFQNYLIGQVSLALLMGISQTCMFLIFRVQFGLLFGLGIGILSLIPFGDVVSLITITLIIATHDFWLALKIVAVAVIIDQLIDQAIAPRLLGKFTGIRPTWVIISLLVGTYIGGVLGLLIAVPIAGIIKDAVDGLSGDLPNQELPEMLEESKS
ncbi:AI-2E family transporter [Richelia sinica]|nr:AI-2E family transporter [Richelia sinica]MBD2665679.1 AI-2E family transporter [Richelia sinica FACHB-800]